MSERQAVGLIWWQSVMAFLSFFAGAGTIGGVVPAPLASVFYVFVGALQAGTAVYVANIQRTIPKSYEPQADAGYGGVSVNRGEVGDE